VTVFAASSLREAFEDARTSFTNEHPQLRLDFQFAGTQALRLQLEHGARADIFASADQRHADAMAAAQVTDPPVRFARNEPVMVVTAASAGASLGSFADLAKAERIVVGADEVPIGTYTRMVLTRAYTSYGADFKAQVERRIVSRELNVRQILAKVRLGEATAGIVYRSDVVAVPEGVRVIDIPRELNVTADYFIAKVRTSPHPESAAAFITWTLSAEGQAALTRRGFEGAN
jgi:molybdate transport system substrate-binding protein